jgi:hypothetical protein
MKRGATCSLAGVNVISSDSRGNASLPSESITEMQYWPAAALARSRDSFDGRDHLRCRRITAPLMLVGK